MEGRLRGSAGGVGPAAIAAFLLLGGLLASPAWAQQVTMREKRSVRESRRRARGEGRR